MSDELKELLEKDRDTHKKRRWEGTFQQYLDEVIRQDFAVPKLAHRRIYDMIEAAGIEPVSKSDDPRVKRIFGDNPDNLKRYHFFAKDFSKTLFSFQNSNIFFSISGIFIISHFL